MDIRARVVEHMPFYTVMAMDMEEAREANERLVESLYAALAAGDGAAAAGLLAEDVDWWFHGPRRCEHMRRRLTGEAGGAGHFVFAPRRVAAVGRDGRWVVAEGWEGPLAYWVHAWVVEGGRITRFREYFNTTVTVREVGGSGQLRCGVGGGAAVCWQSQQGCGGDVEIRSLPGLVLAI